MSDAQPTLLSPRVLLPFILVTLIWGSTWIVIKGQLGVVPPSWSVTYRFAVAAIPMFLFAALRRDRMGIGPPAMRSEERRVGRGCVRAGRVQVWRVNKQKNRQHNHH